VILWSFLNLFSYEKVFPKKLVVGFDYFCLNKYDTFLKFNYYILLVLLVFSCKKEDNLQQEKKIEKSEFSVNTKHSKILPIKDIFKKEVESWEELNSIETFLDRFKNISVNEALGSASDLTELAKSLKDSVIPNKFDKTSFKARVNIFYNEKEAISIGINFVMYLLYFCTRRKKHHPSFRCQSYQFQHLYWCTA
jgi:hypothetical protein